MADYSKIAIKGTAIIFLFTILSSFFGYLVKMVLANKLTVEQYGLFYAVFAFVNVLWMFKHLGLNSALTKITSQLFAKKDFSEIKSAIYMVLIMEFILSSILTLIFVILAKTLSLSYFKSISAKWILIILMIYFLVSTIIDVLIAFFLGWQKHNYYAMYLILLNSLVLMFIIILPGSFGILSPALAYLFSSIILSTIYIILFIKVFPFPNTKFSWSKDLARMLIGFSLPMILTMISGKIIGYIDTLMLTYFRTLNEVGVYNVVLPTSLLLIIVGSSLGTVLFPMTSELWSKGETNKFTEGLKIVYKYIFILVMPIGLLLISFSQIILRVLFGDGYIQGVLAMQILMIGTIFYTVAIVNINILNGINKPKEVTLIIFIGMIINVIVNLFLIPIYGINGAALATTLSYLLIFGFSCLKVSKLLNFNFPWHSWLNTLFAGAILVSTIYLLKPNMFVSNIFLNVLISAIIGVSSYIISLFVFNLIKKEDLIYLKKLIFK